MLDHLSQRLLTDPKDLLNENKAVMCDVLRECGDQSGMYQILWHIESFLLLICLAAFLIKHSDIVEKQF